MGVYSNSMTTPFYLFGLIAEFHIFPSRTMGGEGGGGGRPSLNQQCSLLSPALSSRRRGRKKEQRNAKHIPAGRGNPLFQCRSSCGLISVFASLDRDCHDEGCGERHRGDEVQVPDLHIRAWVFIRAFPKANGRVVHRRARRVAGPSHGS